MSFAMERATMLGIRQRAESAAGVDTGPAWRETVWFVALLVTGLTILAIALTRTPLLRKSQYVVGLTAAATLVLFRFTSAAAAVALAAFGFALAVLLWRAWPPGRPSRAASVAPAAPVAVSP